MTVHSKSGSLRRAHYSFGDCGNIKLRQHQGIRPEILQTCCRRYSIMQTIDENEFSTLSSSHTKVLVMPPFDLTNLTGIFLLHYPPIQVSTTTTHRRRRPIYDAINYASGNIAHHLRKCGRQKDPLQYFCYLATVLSAGRTVSIRGNRLFGTCYRGVEWEKSNLYPNPQLL